MALSNWDTLAFDSEGAPCNGVIEGLSGKASVEIYKNWLYVHDARMWPKGGRFTKPVIAKIEEGSVELSDFKILAKRGPQSSVLAYVESVKYKDQKKGESYRPPDVKRMAGIGCSGYSDPVEVWLKDHNITTGPDDDFFFGSSGGPEGSFMTLTIMRKGWDESSDPRATGLIQEIKIPQTDANEERYGTKWVGVQPETIKALFDFLKEQFRPKYEKEERAWVEKIEAAQPIRFNQGDQYFAQRFGELTPASIPGEADTPLLQRALEPKKRGRRPKLLPKVPKELPKPE